MGPLLIDGWIGALIALLGGYLLGSIPFGVIVTKAAGVGDVRTIGSGNIGATNVLRTGRRDLAAITLLLDGSKGVVAVLLAQALGVGLAPLAAVGAFFGHLFPVWLRFSGGKGVATFLGIALALHWPTGLIAVAGWLLGMAVARISSVGAIIAVIVAPVAAAFFYRADVTLLLIALALMVLWKHGDNIGRLLNGTEPRIGQRPPA